MRLLIVIGYNKPTDQPAAVYVGRDAKAMEAAIAAAPYQTLEKFLNPTGIRKNNSAAQANAARLAHLASLRVASPDPSPPPDESLDGLSPEDSPPAARRRR